MKDALRRPTWAECAAAGMSQREAAEARGVSVSAACRAAKRLGIAFRSVIDDPEFAKANAERASERMRKLHQNPEFAKANAERASEWMRKLHQNPEFNPLATLSDSERSNYDKLKRAGYTRDKAFRAIGRDDLVKT